MKKRTILAVLGAALLLAGACGGGDDAEEPAAGGDQVESADALPVTVTASGFKFDPDTMEGHATHTIDLTFVNEDDALHSFTIDDLDVDVEASGGEEATETFTPEEVGTFEYYCKYHSDMTGKLEVT